MNISYSVRTLDDQLKSAYDRLLPEQTEVNAAGKLEWKFDRNPAARGLISVAEADGQIVGLSSYVPARLRIGGETALGFQAIDSVVDESMRGRGLFTELARAFSNAAADNKVDVVYGIPNVQAAPAWFGKKLEWTRLRSPPFLFKPLAASYFLRRLGLPGDFPTSFARDQNAAPLKRFDDRADALWERFSKGLAPAVEKTSAYLNWRIMDCPSTRYRTVATGDFSFVTSLAAAKHGGRVGYILEAMGDDALPLLMSELGRLKNDDTEVVLAWCAPDSPNYATYRKAGFFPLPEKLRPIIMHFGARAYTPRAQPAVALPGWHLSYLDSDTV